VLVLRHDTNALASDYAKWLRTDCFFASPNHFMIIERCRELKNGQSVSKVNVTGNVRDARPSIVWARVVARAMSIPRTVDRLGCQTEKPLR